ncbi:MAG: hypothetical protein A2V70_12020, partial [Planctomycetes bacterium RBG_13_63_9]
MRFGNGPDQCDDLGARDVWVWKADGTYYMHYDAAGPNGWLCSLATSNDLLKWSKHGPVLDFGAAGTDDHRSASFGVTCSCEGRWHMFYMGTPNTSPAPEYVPAFPYLTMKAEAASPKGPWRKRYDVVPFRTEAGTYYAVTASPGHVVRMGRQYRMFFSAAMIDGGRVQRTLGIARTEDLDRGWRIDPQPIVSSEEQIENSSLYYQPDDKTWFLFTNHVGIGDDAQGEYTDAVWVYWSKDLDRWDATHKAVVLDGANCSWSRKCIGLPSVIRVGNRLAIFYDAPGSDRTSHVRR